LYQQQVERGTLHPSDRVVIPTEAKRSGGTCCYFFGSEPLLS
jgi:hypothetical protein